MVAAVYKLEIEQGVYTELPIEVTDPETGDPINLTGYTARLMARKDINDASPFLTLTTENGGITIDAVDGIITLIITDTQSSALANYCGVYDLEVIVGGKPKRWLQGPIEISREVTR